MTRAYQEDLQTKERQLHQLRQELQEKQQTQANLELEYRNRERLLQQQLQDSQESERVLRQECDDLHQEHDDYRQQHDNIEQRLRQQLQESTTALQQTHQANATLQQQVQQLQEQSHWVRRKEEIEMTDEVFGKGVFTREMEIAARVRHPNLLQFIGATQVGTPIILSELMPTSLRKELEAGPLPYHAVLAISQDIACGLNYLHLFKPDPILHRDVSTANVLLLPIGGGWRAKVSDYGSANLQPMIGHTVYPGNPVYSAPEAGIPKDHSPAMDVYSYGVVLIEMMICRIPEVAQRQLHINSIRQPMFKALIERCLKENRRERPTIERALQEYLQTKERQLHRELQEKQQTQCEKLNTVLNIILLL
ncbi:dual specificity protein kinase shkE-like [Gigantopelta aegis]|uniref:dual specificity protein kinase shkE-like n=1 Tax=Gigantopelta aegis TaxID=1735272 RepID=UPI001B88C3A0|nr:dual specificity protein kinase shkE-like [Gigantopelta aegis]